jgi:hypothetical protein
LRPPQNSKAWSLGFKSSRFLKKAAQKLLHCRRRAFESPEAQIKKVFLLRAGRPGFSSEKEELSLRD